MKFKAIDKQRKEYRVPWMCRILKVSTSGFYAWRKRPASKRVDDDVRLRIEIRAYHRKSRGTYGSPRILHDLRGAGLRVGRNRIIRLMRLDDLSGRRKRKYVHTTNSKHEFPVAPNVLDRNFKADKANMAWVGDITYISTGEGFSYLAVLLDLYSRKVVGWAIDSSMATALPLQALQMAYVTRNPGPGLIHHTDRGSQYASKLYRRFLQERGMTCSMSRRGECWDNAVGESFFGRLKDDLVYRTKWATHAEAARGIEEYIENFYNSVRRHSSAGDMSPNDYENSGQAASSTI
jgi:putative transposase